MQFTDRHNGRRNGFSLIEILVVLALIVVLMGLLIPAIGKMKRNAVKAQAAAHMHAIKSGLQEYYNTFASTFPPSSPVYGNIAVGRGAAMLAQGLMGFLPGNQDGAGPPNLGDPVYGFRTRQSAMGGQVYGPFMSPDTKGYQSTSPYTAGKDEVFIDPWEHEILYFRSSRVQPSQTSIDNVFLSQGAPDNNKTYFKSDDCSKDVAGGAMDDPTTKQVFLNMIYPNGVGQANANDYTPKGNVQGADSYLLISAGPDGIYYTADDIIESK